MPATRPGTGCPSIRAAYTTPMLSGTTRSAALITARYRGSRAASIAISLPKVTMCAKRRAATSSMTRRSASLGETTSSRLPKICSACCGCPEELTSGNRRRGRDPGRKHGIQRARLLRGKIAQRWPAAADTEPETPHRGLDRNGRCHREQTAEQGQERAVQASRAVGVARLECREHVGDRRTCDMAGDADHATGPDRSSRQREMIVARVDVDVRAYARAHLGDLAEIAARFFDRDDTWMLGQRRDGLRQDVDGCAARDVVDHDWQPRGIGDTREMSYHPGLRRLVVVRPDQHQRVDAGLLGSHAELDRMAGVVAAGVGDDRRSIADRLHHGAEELEFFFVVERRRLARGAGEHEPAAAMLDQPARETSRFLVVDGAVGLHRRDHGGDDRPKTTETHP